MADCTKTVEFLREWKRMCKKAGFCGCCPLCKLVEDDELATCNQLIEKRTEDAIAIVQKWSDEHPVMTWAGKLKELLPNADIESIICGGCPCDYFGAIAPNNEKCNATEECRVCWSGEYKEAP